ncbi:MAG: PrsW family intramembrane metalloprotease [Oscillospiraceae bacterium]|nr:PrsW family intramembrane metalloprotease [Oscillospiraceae bacterium]
MEWNEILLVCAALLPAIALCIYVYKKDRVEKEPIGLLMGLLVLGALSCYPAGELESVAFDWIREIFKPFGQESEGVLYLSDTTYKIYNAVKYVFGVALIEEGIKFLILFTVTKDNKNFNSLFDGLIYAIFVSLGFAALENVFYVLRYGWQTAIARAIYSVPGHMFFSVLMGYGYSMWHMYKLAARQEKELKKLALIPHNVKEYSGTASIVWALVLPIAAHGLYDYCCTIESVVGDVVLYLLMLFLYFHCFSRIHKMSRNDMKDSTFVGALIVKKYPYLLDLFTKKQDVEQPAATEE